MDCEQTRRAVVIDPFHLHAEAQNHADQCGVCTAFLSGHQQHSALLRQGMIQTQAPHLRERLLAAHLHEQAQSHRVSRRWWLSAAAASVALGAVGLGTWRSQNASPNQAEHWAQLMQEHFLEDPLHLLPPDPKAASLLDGVLSRIGAKRMAELPRVLRVQYCMLREQRSAHLVCEVNGQRGVVFVVPEKTAQYASLQVQGWMGDMRALVGGTAGVFAQDAATVQKLGEAVTSSLLVKT
jgi:hypothetical protein